MSDDPTQLIHRAAHSVRAPYDVPDPTFDAVDRAAWRQLRRLDREAALRDPVDGIEVTEYESRIVKHLAESSEPHVVAVLVALLWRARQAAPLPAARVHSGRA